jgi:phosphatidylserine/phosphatidylglycerophosphate/cardiolipin synthase-like enzyme
VHAMAAHVNQQTGRREPAAVPNGANPLIDDARRKEGHDNSKNAHVPIVRPARSPRNSAHAAHLILSYGVPLGEQYTFKNGKAVARRTIKDFGLVQWFLEEEHYRSKNEGFVFFVHTKFLLIDPLSDDPLVCSGSANFSSNSLLQNDENMLLIRGNTRVADIYMTEFDRLFRHFYFRDVANELEAKGKNARSIFLDESDDWSASYFWKDGFKSLRRQMFFSDPHPRWFENAAAAKPAKKKTAKTVAKKKSATKTSAKKKSAKKR